MKLWANILIRDIHYMDIISECEKLGDYVVNVVEARTDIKEKKI